ncbi:hypothetical protein Athai_10500 [Actinocatenispora thailandica]|uniref:Uncharacterized protein n=1 Tax=Actinocatenispora thailandica TaxID=227318 RepID=A0A7R7HUX5_9ACTN|nr:hypothetical protein [Actinocatenispora thailandica]BCJ33547.1 hypothetical protein Athai_10500 [Actinocatenispora thailandica]
MSAVDVTGAMPLPGDQVPISPAVAPLAVGADILTVLWVQHCETPGWAYLTGTWPGGQAARVMVWLDHLVLRRPTPADPDRRVDHGIVRSGRRLPAG